MPRKELPKDPPKDQRGRKEWYRIMEERRRRADDAAKARREAGLGLAAKPAATQTGKPAIKDHAELGTLLRNAGYAKHLGELESLRQAHGNDVINHFLRQSQFEKGKSTAAVDALERAARAGELAKIAEALPKKPVPAAGPPVLKVIGKASHAWMAEELKNALRDSWRDVTPGVLEKVTPELMHEILESKSSHPDMGYYRKLFSIVIERSDASRYDFAAEQLGRAIRNGKLRKALDHGKEAPKQAAAPESSVTSEVDHERMAERLKEALRIEWPGVTPRTLQEVTPDLVREILNSKSTHLMMRYYRRFLETIMARRGVPNSFAASQAGRAIEFQTAHNYAYAAEQLGGAIESGTLRKALDHGKEAPKPAGTGEANSDYWKRQPRPSAVDVNRVLGKQLPLGKSNLSAVDVAVLLGAIANMKEEYIHAIVDGGGSEAMTLVKIAIAELRGVDTGDLLGLAKKVNTLVVEREKNR